MLNPSISYSVSKDSVYIQYLKVKHVSTEKKDSLDGAVRHESHSKVIEVFEEYIDKRYFFKLLGEAYWVEISPETYATKRAICSEFEIPNDHELRLETTESHAP